MNRITPEEVLAAYEKTGLKPGRFLYKDNYLKCGCPVTALAESIGCTYEPSDEGLFLARFARERELNISYLNGFINGVDSTNHPTTSEKKEFIDGFEDGRLVWEAVRPNEH